MGKTESGITGNDEPRALQDVNSWIQRRSREIWATLQDKNWLVAKRMLKNTVATTAALIIATDDRVLKVYGKATYLMALATVFGHPGRRLGQHVEALILASFGTIVGVAWACLGVYLSSLVFAQNAPAAYTIRGIFMVLALLFHGMLRSRTPRLFLFVLLFIIASVVILTGTSKSVTKALVIGVAAPILTAIALVLVVNVCIFPELSSSFIGITTIETLGEAVGTVRDAGIYFTKSTEPSPAPRSDSDASTPSLEETIAKGIQRRQTIAEKALKPEPSRVSKCFHSMLRKTRRFMRHDHVHEEPPKDDPTEKPRVTLKSLTDRKSKIRAKLAACKEAQQECNFEIAISMLPPADLKPISDTQMQQLIANTIALVGACESKYALTGDLEEGPKSEKKEPQNRPSGFEIGPPEDLDADLGGDGQEDDQGDDQVDDQVDDQDDGPASHTSSPIQRPVSTSALSNRIKSMLSLSAPSSRRPSFDASYDRSGTATPHSTMRRKRKRSETRDSESSFDNDLRNIELAKPKREIEAADPELLRSIIGRVAAPISEMQSCIDECVDVVAASLGYCYGVKTLPSGVATPNTVELRDIDAKIEILQGALDVFDLASEAAFERVNHPDDSRSGTIDVSPRIEVFLVSSFILNLHQAGIHTLEMLKESRLLVEKRKAVRRRTFYAPRINWQKWLNSGGESDAFALPTAAREEQRSGTAEHVEDDGGSTRSNNGVFETKTPPERQPHKGSKTRLRRALSNLADRLGVAKAVDLSHRHRDEEAAIPPPAIPSSRRNSSSTEVVQQQSPESTPFWIEFRSHLASFVDYLTHSDDVIYAVKLTFAMLLVTFPAFVAKWNAWYSTNRGLWAALQLVLVTEVAIGASVWIFILRAIGTTIGCLWGLAAYKAYDGNRGVTIVMLVIGIVPSTYVQLGTKYVKAGMVSIISMSIVALATLDGGLHGTSAEENFLKRWVAFLIGGIVALLIEVVFLPVRARDRLVESLASSIRHIIEMEAMLAPNLDPPDQFRISSSGPTDEKQQLYTRFAHAHGKATASLLGAETFLPFCAQEPRLKGSFAVLEMVYKEMLIVLHQIVDKMDNMLQLRKNYGAGVVEELEDEVRAYRRNVAGSVQLILYAVCEALETKLPLPQFLPSARLAHLRMVNRVRWIVDGRLRTGRGRVFALKREEGNPLVPVDSNVAHPNNSGISMLERGRNGSGSGLKRGLGRRIVKQKYLSWNAASAGQIEVIEYLEELVVLAKLLVGSLEFKSGLLTRITYREYVRGVGQGGAGGGGGGEEADAETQAEGENGAREGSVERREGETTADEDDQRGEERDTVAEQPTRKFGLGGILKRRRTSLVAQTTRNLSKVSSGASRGSRGSSGQSVEEDELPMSLQRVRTLKLEQSRSAGAAKTIGRRESWKGKGKGVGKKNV